jgi:hypothetical protein
LLQPRSGTIAAVEANQDAPICWIPIFGQFDTTPAEIRFHGRLLPASQADAQPNAEPIQLASIGLLMSSLTLADGDVSATIELSNVTERTYCELAVAYDINASHVVSAGLGGESWAMFSIREYGGPRTDGKGWFLHHARGERQSLQANRPYRLKARFRGALVSLTINGVDVGVAEVAPPQGRARQVGLICRSEHDITIRDFSVSGIKPKAFVVTQFSEQYDDVFNHVIKGLCEAYEVKVIRADDISGPGLIISDIIREITEAQLVIADISPSNLNVYFEVGYSLALRKPTILLAKKGTSLPFDVAGFRVLFYEDTIGGKSKLEAGLRTHLEAILAPASPDSD